MFTLPKTLKNMTWIRYFLKAKRSMIRKTALCYLLSAELKQKKEKVEVKKLRLSGRLRSIK
ncbi:hypothetical protein DRO59_04155 [Candidatus Bathyarchaeota archaeon]|nr:MAG: hypothetical protein DRO59_04155 [Candidatus Bathyarchaeota archaeon]